MNNSHVPTSAKPLVIAMIAIVGALPLAIYWIWVGQSLALPDASHAPFVARPLLEQWALFLTGFVVKPVYMLMSLILIGVLWRRDDRDLASLRRSFIFFLVGETACLFNYLVFQHRSDFAEFLHGYGMVAAFAFAIYALIEGFDSRVLLFSEPGKRCAALRLCQSCYKTVPAPCGLRRLFMFLILALLVLSLAPFCASPLAVSYSADVLGRPYHFTHAALYQIFEIRYCPAVSAAFLAAALVVMLTKTAPVPLAKVLFAAGAGALGFGLFRLFLFQTFRDRVAWFNSWEEITELLFVAGCALVLWLFRFRLFAERNPDQAR